MTRLFIYGSVDRLNSPRETRKCGKKKKKKKKEKKSRPMRKRPVGLQASHHAQGLSATSAVIPNMAVSVALSPAAAASMLLLTFVATLFIHRSVAEIDAGASATEETPHRRFEYKYSFKGPHLSQNDGSIPFWIHTGSKFESSCQHHTTAAAATAT